MKALILAGGEGTRLRPITHTRAKQLVPVANKPILFYGIEAMVAAGITEIGVIIGATGPEVREALGDGSAFGAAITFLPQDAPLGLAHCVLIAQDFLGDDDFVMYLGDNLLEQDLGAFVDAFEQARTRPEPPAAQILLKRVPDPQRFGIATLDGDGNVVALVEKPADPPSDLALVGVYLFDPSIHEAVRSIQPSPRDELSTLDGRIIVDEGAEIINSTIRGPVAIGRDTSVVDSFIGPFSAIGAGCTVDTSEIEHSVVMDGSQVLHIPRLEDSLIGRETVIDRTSRRPRALRLMIGDHCQIDIE